MLVIIIEVFLFYERSSVHPGALCTVPLMSAACVCQMAHHWLPCCNTQTSCTPIQLKASIKWKKKCKPTLFILVLLHFCSSSHYRWCTATSFQRFSFSDQTGHWILFFLWIFCLSLSYDPVGGHFFKCLKIFHSCNYATLIRFIWHIMYALYIPGLTGHVQSDSSLIYQHINTVSCNIA